MLTLSYAERIPYCINPAAQKLLQIISDKQSNLSVSADFVQKKDLLAFADQVGPEICVLKTHIDILEDFDPAVTQTLTYLAQKHHFLIFEDRKFADIGNTVQLQYAHGLYRISDWAHITNIHTLVGPGSIESLKSVGLIKGNGLLLLAQMTPKGNLLDQHYTQASIDMASAHPDFVMGFIATERLTPNPALIHFTPGIHIEAEDDPLGQQYTSPQVAIFEKDVDVVIVGRGIYKATNPLSAAKMYRKLAWEAYLKKIHS